MAHLFATCQFNGLHFVKKEELDMHELTCPDKLEVRRMVETMKRNYNSMRERSRSLGGELRLHSRPQAGWALCLNIPLETAL